MPGAENLHNCQPLQELLKAQNAKKGKIAAICASPAVVLGQLGLIEGKRATCYPGFEKLCTGAKMEDARCVTEDNIVTANGPSSVTNMCYAIITISKGKQTANEVMTGMLIYPKQQPYYF
jgi:4-methyl-5(b-hydroxyethyl)-thiazole monophosphate biosynthesis